MRNGGPSQIEFSKRSAADRMLGNIVLLETMNATGKHPRIFKLQFADGEFDMVIYDGGTGLL